MKIPKPVVEEEIAHTDIWTDDETAWWYDEYKEDYWDGVAAGEMSWQWYMEVSIRYREGWRHVIINDSHKNITVKNWLEENYSGCEYKNERNHFLFKDHKVATMVALKWS
jgi:hypothetical protein